MDLFDLHNGDRFEWQGRKFTLIRIDESMVAIVVEDAVAGEQGFNPFATITKPQEN